MTKQILLALCIIFLLTLPVFSYSRIPYVDEANWALSEQNGLARIAKLNAKWLDEISDVEANIASKHVDDFFASAQDIIQAETDIQKLLNTNIGRNTLKLADATDDLLAKQIKLANNWGVGKVDEVINKCFLFVCYGNRIDDMNKILKAMPETFVDNFDPNRAVKFLGDLKLVEAAGDIVKGVDSSIISSVVGNIDGFEKLLEYTKAVKKLDPTILNPLGEIGKHQLLKIYKSSTVSTKVSDETILGVGILKKGELIIKPDGTFGGFGWEHISTTRPNGVNHAQDIKNALSLIDADAEVKNVISEVMETGVIKQHAPGEVFIIEKTITRGSKSKGIRVVVSDQPGSVGSITTSHPI